LESQAGKGKAYNATLSDESEEEEETPAQDQFLAFVAPHEDQEYSQSYYSKHSDEDRKNSNRPIKSFYKEFEKLRRLVSSTSMS